MTKKDYYARKWEDYQNAKRERELERQKREQEYQQREKERELANKKRERKNFVTGSDGKGSIFRIILIILLFISMARILIGSEFSVSLGGFLEYIVNVPDVSLSWLRGVDLTIFADWGIFDFFRIFLNSVTGVLEVALMLVGGILQLLTYVAYLVAYIFL